MPAEDHHILKTYFPASASYSFTFNVFFWSLICSWETSLLEQFLYHHMSWWALVANIEQLWYHLNIWAALVIEHHVSWWEQWCHHMCCLVPPGPSALDTNCSCISGKRIEHVLWEIASLVDWEIFILLKSEKGFRYLRSLPLSLAREQSHPQLPIFAFCIKEMLTDSDEAYG